MKITLIFILALNTLLAVSQDIPVSPVRGEFYIITEAYLIIDDSIYTMQDEFVDVTSKVFMMFNDDSTTIITVDQGKDSVVFMGDATEVDDEGIRFSERQEDCLRMDMSFHILEKTGCRTGSKGIFIRHGGNDSL